MIFSWASLNSRITALSLSISFCFSCKASTIETADKSEESIDDDIETAASAEILDDQNKDGEVKEDHK